MLILEIEAVEFPWLPSPFKQRVDQSMEEKDQETFTCSKWTIESPEKGMKYVQSKQQTPEQRKWHYAGVFMVNFEHISHLFLESLLLTLNK